MKKSSVFLLVLAVLAGGFAFAAGGDQKQSSQDGGPREIIYWSHYGQSPAIVQAWADTANAALKKLGYTNVTCRAEVIEYSGYETKYLTAFAGGNGPDIFLAQPQKFAQDAGINPVGIAFPDDVAKAWNDALAPCYKTSTLFQGKRYGFPVEGGDLLMLYINTDHFREAGIDPEKNYPKTIDEFLAAAQKLTKYDAGGKIIRSGYHPRYTNGGGNICGKFLPFVHIFGGRALSPDLKKAQGYMNGPETTEAFQFYQDLVTKYKVVNMELGLPEPAFQSGQTSMLIREGWLAQDIIDKAPDIHFKVVPFVSGKKNIIPGGSPWQNMINAQSKHLDVIFPMFKELAKPEYDVMFHEPANYPPVLEGTMTMSNPYFSRLPYAQAVIDSLKKDPPILYSESAKFYEVENMIGDAVTAVLTGADVKTTLNSLAERMQVILDQN